MWLPVAILLGFLIALVLCAVALYWCVDVLVRHYTDVAEDAREKREARRKA